MTSLYQSQLADALYSPNNAPNTISYCFYQDHFLLRCIYCSSFSRLVVSNSLFIAAMSAFAFECQHFCAGSHYWVPLTHRSKWRRRNSEKSCLYITGNSFDTQRKNSQSISQARGHTPNTSPICCTTDFSRLQISKLKLSAEVEKFPETEWYSNHTFFLLLRAKLSFTCFQNEVDYLVELILARVRVIDCSIDCLKLAEIQV